MFSLCTRVQRSKFKKEKAERSTQHYPVSDLSQFLSLSDGSEKGPLALSAIPTEIRQGEEHPVSTVSPLSTLPEVRTTNNPPAPDTFFPLSLSFSQQSFLILVSHFNPPLLLPSLLAGETATTGEVGRCKHSSEALPHTVQGRLRLSAVGPLN